MREEVLYLACNEEQAFSVSEEHKRYNLWTCQKVTEALLQNAGIQIGTNCVPLLLICFYFAMRGTSCSLSQKKNGMP